MSQKLDRFHKYLNLYQKLVKVNAGKFVDERLAEDVAQETFLKMYLHLDYLDEEKVKSWLIVVSGNIAKDYLKKGGNVEVELLDPCEMAECEAYTTESAEEGFEKIEREKAVNTLLRTACSLLYEKNPKWYYILIDSYMLGMSSAEIAKVLGTTAGNVDVMKTRAKAYLRKELHEEYLELF